MWPLSEMYRPALILAPEDHRCEWPTHLTNYPNKIGFEPKDTSLRLHKCTICSESVDQPICQTLEIFFRGKFDRVTFLEVPIPGVLAFGKLSTANFDQFDGFLDR